MVHYARQAQLPPVKMKLARARGSGFPAPATRAKPAAAAVAPPPPRPPLTRRTSSTNHVVTTLNKQVEMRYRTLREAFRAADRDGLGGITKEQLQAALFLWQVRAQARHIDGIMADFDRNGDGMIDFSEFCDGLKPFSVTSQPIFGLGDRYVTDGYRVFADQVLINDNLPAQPFRQRSPGARPYSMVRPDASLIELPRGATPASVEQIHSHTADLSNRIHEKYKKLKDAFRSFDENKDGKLSKQELIMAVRCFNLPIPEEHVAAILAKCDVDGDGQISYNEFANVLKRKDALGR